MKDRTLIILALTVMIMNSFVIFTANYNFTGQHEKVHAEICREDGGEANVTVNFLGGGSTECTRVESTDLHMMNEVVGYQMRSLMNAMLLSNFVVLIVGVLTVYSLGDRR